jgi:rhamnose utilization protein RhaD (predicted bifunctional aldolase and dehydrogenase)
LRTVTEASFVRVSLDRATAMLATPHLDDDAVLEALIAAKVDGAAHPLPSVETVVHAACLCLPGVRFVGHTHPTDVNAITCSAQFRDLLSGRIFPDEVVVCGPEPVLVGYVDPGLKLAIELRRALDAYLAWRKAAPKTVYLQNHGFIALGETPREVENITAMAAKSARILMGTLAAGGPNFLPPDQVERIHNRADEHYRQRIIREGA